MIEKALESPGYLRSLEIKGGAGSGNFGHSGRPGQLGGSGAGGKGKWSATNVNGAVKGGKIDRAKYKALGASERTQVLQFALSKYKEKYVPQPKVNTRSKKWNDANKTIGQMEAIRRAFVNKAEKLSGKDKRKVYHSAIALQERAGALASARDGK